MWCVVWTVRWNIHPISKIFTNKEEAIAYIQDGKVEDPGTNYELYRMEREDKPNDP